MQVNSESSTFAFAFLVVIPEMIAFAVRVCLLGWNEAGEPRGLTLAIPWEKPPKAPGKAPLATPYTYSYSFPTPCF